MLERWEHARIQLYVVDNLRGSLHFDGTKCFTINKRRFPFRLLGHAKSVKHFERHSAKYTIADTVLPRVIVDFTSGA